MAMDAEEKLFWVGIAIFGGVFCEGLYLVVDSSHLVSALVFVFVGLLGLLLLVRDNAKKIPVRFYMLILAALMSWVGLAYDYYDRHFVGNRIYTSVRIGKGEFTTNMGNAAIPIDPEVGKPTAMNIGVKNYGPLPALGVSYAFQIKWLPVMTRSAENDTWSEFRKDVPLTEPMDFDVGQEQWKTVTSQSLSQDDISDIGKGNKVLYQFVHFEYRDNGGAHQTDHCRFLQTPLQPQEIVWEVCSGEHSSKIR